MGLHRREWLSNKELVTISRKMFHYPNIFCSWNCDRSIYVPEFLAHNRTVPALDDSSKTHLPVINVARIAWRGGHWVQLRDIKTLVDAAGSPIGKIPVAPGVRYIVAMTVKVPGPACGNRSVAIFAQAAPQPATRKVSEAAIHVPGDDSSG